VKPLLLDVNVLVALAWPSHVHHQQAQDWFARRRRAGFRTCPLTETGFVRISSNPRFTPDAVAPLEALILLDRITSLAGFEFWSADIPLGAAIGKDRPIVGHRQVTDAYLIALAAKRAGKLATFDRAPWVWRGPRILLNWFSKRARSQPSKETRW
jgi:toxin-antitoxin system PIN domain toxin